MVCLSESNYKLPDVKFPRIKEIPVSSLNNLETNLNYIDFNVASSKIDNTNIKYSANGQL